MPSARSVWRRSSGPARRPARSSRSSSPGCATRWPRPDPVTLPRRALGQVVPYAPRIRVVQRIHLNRASGVPVFRQVIDQIVFMIEAGELQDGDRLPSSRLLATNLDVNRNTTARAYAELNRLGYLSSQGRAGMVVRRSEQAREDLAKHEAAVAALSGAVRECIEM